MQNVPSLSSIDFDYILPFKGYEADNEWLQNWSNNGIFTWVLLKKQATLAEAQNKIAKVLETNDRQSNVELFLQPVKDMYLYTDYANGKYGGGGKIENVRMFGLVALLIILIACINFMNLSTARSRTRAKEIGLRKVIGAKRASLIYQFFIESFTVAFVAVLLALLIVDFCLPYFNNLIAGKMIISYQQPFIWLLLGSIFLADWLVVRLLSRFIIIWF